MKNLRSFLFCAIFLVLATGYVASQYAYFTGNAAEYASAVDQPIFRLAACAILVTIVLVALLPDGSKE